MKVRKLSCHKESKKKVKQRNLGCKTHLFMHIYKVYMHKKMSNTCLFILKTKILKSRNCMDNIDYTKLKKNDNVAHLVCHDGDGTKPCFDMYSEPFNLFCVRPTNHDGPHMGCGNGDKLYAMWKKENGTIINLI